MLGLIVGAALLGIIIAITARLFVPYDIAHPLVALAFLALTSVTFSLFGFLTGIWADGWEKLSIIPMMVITPLTFLGGSFYSISMLPDPWKQIALGNPVVKTPNVDALVSTGFIFRRAYTMGSMEGAVCLPSRTMFLTGMSMFRAMQAVPPRGNNCGKIASSGSPARISSAIRRR